VSDETPGFGATTVDAFTSQLASAEPVPGGGSAAAVAASLGAALAVMVGRLSEGRPRYAAHAGTHQRAIQAGEAARRRFIELADIDARVYGGYAAAMKLPRETDAERATRAAAIAQAAKASTLAPLDTVRLCESVVQVVESLAGRSNVNAASDLDVAALLLEAAAEGAAANVRINLPSVADAPFVEEAQDEVARVLATTHRIAAQVRRIVADGTAREPEAA
jgi:glutamate formiminotransferase/formiminotetrahydrofolate cyclodeaminase